MVEYQTLSKQFCHEQICDRQIREEQTRNKHVGWLRARSGRLLGPAIVLLLLCATPMHAYALGRVESTFGAIGASSCVGASSCASSSPCVGTSPSVSASSNVVPSSYVLPSAYATAKSPSRTSSNDVCIVQVKQGYLALRSAPSYDESNEIGELYSGETVEVTGESSGNYVWVYSPKLDKSGYVDKRYLIETETRMSNSFKEGDSITVKGVVRHAQAEHKGSTYDCYVLLLDEPVDAFVASYPAGSKEPSLHKDVPSADVQLRKGSIESLVGKHLRVSGTVRPGGKFTPWMEKDGTFYKGGGDLIIRDATYEVL